MALFIHEVKKTKRKLLEGYLYNAKNLICCN